MNSIPTPRFGAGTLMFHIPKGTSFLKHYELYDALEKGGFSDSVNTNYVWQYGSYPGDRADFMYAKSNDDAGDQHLLSLAAKFPNFNHIWRPVKLDDTGLDKAAKSLMDAIYA